MEYCAVSDVFIFDHCPGSHHLRNQSKLCNPLNALIFMPVDPRLCACQCVCVCMCVQLEARRRISEKSPTSPSENRHQPGFRNTALMAWLPFAKSSVTVFKTNIYYIKSSEMK